MIQKVRQAPGDRRIRAGCDGCRHRRDRGAVIVLGRRTLTNIPTIALALVTLVLLWRWKKISEPFVVLGAAVIGLIMFSLLHH